MRRKHMFKNIVAIVFAQVIVKIFGLLYKLYLANKPGFGDVGNAIYNGGYQIYALLLTISSIGVPNAVAKMVIEHGNSKRDVASIMKSLFFLYSIIGVVGAIILGITARFIANNMLNIPESRMSIIGLSPAIFNVCIISVLRGYYNGTKEFSISAKSQTIEQILKTICTVVFVEITYSITLANTEKMATMANIATTAATFGSFAYLYKKYNLKEITGKIKGGIILKTIAISIPISLSSILASLNRNIDSFTIVRYLKNFIGEQSAIIEYGVLSGKVEVISAVPVSFIIAISSTIIPIVAEKNKLFDKRLLMNTVSKYFEYAIIIVLPCSIGGFLFSDQILRLLFNSTQGSIYFKINMITVFFIALEQIVNATLQGIGKNYVPAASLLIGVIVKYVMNLILLKISPEKSWYAGVTGCCIGTFLCHFVAFAISFCIFSKNLKIKSKILKFLLKQIIPSCIMALTLKKAYLILLGIMQEKLAIILSGGIAIAIYLISTFLLKVVRNRDVICVYISNLTKKEEKRRILYKNGE